MNKLTLLVLAGAAVALPALAQAKSVMTTISMGEFKSRCLAAGGHLSNAGAGGTKCKLPSGASVTCYDVGNGLACDYRIAGGGVKGVLGGAEALGSVTTESHSHGGAAGQGSPGGSANPGNAGGGRAPGAESPGGGSMDPGAGGGIEG